MCSLPLALRLLPLAYMAVLQPYSKLRQAAIAGPKRDSAAASSSSPAVPAPGGRAAACHPEGCPVSYAEGTWSVCHSANW